MRRSGQGRKLWSGIQYDELTTWATRSGRSSSTDHLLYTRGEMPPLQSLRCIKAKQPPIRFGRVKVGVPAKGNDGVNLHSD